MQFKKYVSAGNDFLIFEKSKLDIDDYEDFVQSICHRNFGIGADGVLLSSCSDIADVKMEYFNSDGSEGEMCGNGIMSFIKFIYENDIVRKDFIEVDTKAGIMKAELIVKDEKVQGVKMNLGKPVFPGSKIPVKIDKDEVLQEVLEVDGEEYVFSAVQMGVPHLVIFVDEISSEEVDDLGRKIEHHELFPEKTNVNFIRVKNPDEIDIWTWERGAGRTLGCGTGSSASVVLGNRLNKLGDCVSVHTEGGKLRVELVDGEVYLTGSPRFIGEGKYYY